MDISIGRRQMLGGAAAFGVAGTLGVVGAGSAQATPRRAGGTAEPAGVEADRGVAATRHTVQLGSRGADVTYLQGRLNAVGYWAGVPDGVFGAQTQQAVFALQKSWGLARDGVVGARTWAKVASNARRTARHPGGHHIEIDKARQLILVFWGSNSARYTLNTSTGANKPFRSSGHWYDGRTPSGSFSVFRHSNGWVHNDLGSLYKPYFFNGGIAIHGATSIPPYNASHGCCRLSVAAQDHLIGNGVLVNARRVIVY